MMHRPDPTAPIQPTPRPFGGEPKDAGLWPAVRAWVVLRPRVRGCQARPRSLDVIFLRRAFVEVVSSNDLQRNQIVIGKSRRLDVNSASRLTYVRTRSRTYARARCVDPSNLFIKLLIYINKITRHKLDKRSTKRSTARILSSLLLSGVLRHPVKPLNQLNIAGFGHG